MYGCRHEHWQDFDNSKHFRIKFYHAMEMVQGDISQSDAFAKILRIVFCFCSIEIWAIDWNKMKTDLHESVLNYNTKWYHCHFLRTFHTIWIHKFWKQKKNKLKSGPTTVKQFSLKRIKFYLIFRVCVNKLKFTIAIDWMNALFRLTVLINEII